MSGANASIATTDYRIDGFRKYENAVPVKGPRFAFPKPLGASGPSHPGNLV